MIIAMWIISMLPLIATGVLLPYYPDMVPMHYNVAGEIDSWGSKYSLLIFPCFILLFAMFFYLLVHIQKKAMQSAQDDKTKSSAKQNVKILSYINLIIAIFMSMIDFGLMYKTYVASTSSYIPIEIDIFQLFTILMGVLFVAISNPLPKAKKNSLIGVRVVWSMYNDVTWSKSNRYGGVALLISGIITIVVGVFVRGVLAELLILIILIIFIVATLSYAKKVYKEEVTKDTNGMLM